MPAYLLEIGTEELPSAYIPEAQNDLSEGLAEALRSKSVNFLSVQGMSTPRRLAVLVHDIAATQETTSKKIKGPPVSTSFNADGTARAAATGFAAKHHLTVAQLERQEQGGQTYLIAHVVTCGRPVSEVLQETVPRLISQLSGERMMRWGSSDFKFSRPIRWLVSLLDDKIVDLSVNDLAAGRISYGHRILHPEPISISDAGSYVDSLLKASVQVDPVQRRQSIEREVASLAASLNGAPRQLGGALLDEVVNITEWPAAIAGDFDGEYLDLPDTLIETVMVHHQKYFPVEKVRMEGEAVKAHGQLLPHFITVSNNRRPEARKQIKEGNERVLKARLADGRFFYFDDQKTKLSARQHIVAQLTFQEGLGSYGDKVARMARVAEKLSSVWFLQAKIQVPLVRTLELCKSDLVTNLVRELPELQGFVGSWYAMHEGQPSEVVEAIASHYSPRSADDLIPEDKIGQLASVIDKADNLAGLFSLGKKPSGSSDPFALRRHAQGLVDVLMDGLIDVPVNLTELLNELIAEYKPLVSTDKKALPADKVISDLREFLIQRIKWKLATTFTRREIVDASISATDVLDFLPNIRARAQALDALSKSAQGIELIRAGVRIGNILKAGERGTVDENLLVEDAERALWDAYQSAFPENGLDTDTGSIVQLSDYEKILSTLTPLVGPINRFFDDVMVNDENPAKRKNRHALLHTLYLQFKLVGDFPTLQPIIA